MNRPLRALFGLAAGAAILSAAPYALAQDHPAAAPMAERWKEHMHDRTQDMGRALHDILNIRADQEAAFQAFLASMAPPEHGDQRGPEADRAQLAGLTTPQRLDRMAARMAERQAAFQRHIEAVKRFYAALSPDQQRAFDALHALGRHHPFGGPGDHEGMGPMGPMGPMAMGGPEGPDGPEPFEFE